MSSARSRLLLLLSMVVSPLGALPGTAQVSRDVEQLTAVEDAWALAVQQGDVDALSQIVASDYIGTTASGAIQDKEAYLADFTSGDRKTYALTTRDLLITVFGDVAVVTHGGDARGELRGTPTGGSFRWSHVFVRRQGRWGAVMNHVTRVTGGD